MARNRLTDTVTLTCPLSEDEQDFVATMMQMTGIKSEANITRLALYHLARFLELPVSTATFAQRTSRGVKGQFGKGSNRVKEKQLDWREQRGRNRMPLFACTRKRA